jgi:hypothetical protein
MVESLKVVIAASLSRIYRLSFAVAVIIAIQPGLRLFQILNPAKVYWQDELQLQEYGQAKWKSLRNC